MFSKPAPECGCIDGAAVTSVLIHEKHVLVGDERAREVVETSQVAAKDERRARHSPKSEFGALLVLRFARLPRFAPSGMWAQPAFREHVGIGPIARAGVGEPLARRSKAPCNPKGNSSSGLLGKVHPSQWSLEMRHICAYFATSAACSSAVGPGERLSTMGRPVLRMASAIWRISVGR